MTRQGFNTNLKFTTDGTDENDDMLKKAIHGSICVGVSHALVQLTSRGFAIAVHLVNLGAESWQHIRVGWRWQIKQCMLVPCLVVESLHERIMQSTDKTSAYSDATHKASMCCLCGQSAKLNVMCSASVSAVMRWPASRRCATL